MNVRVAAVKVLLRLLGQGGSFAQSLPEELASIADPRDRAWVQAVCYGVSRWFYRLSAILGILLEKPLKAKDQDIVILMLVGLYQIIYMRTPSYAAVAETVAATEKLQKKWAKGLVNAVLRNYQRQAESLLAKADSTSTGQYAHPQWLIRKLQQAWPKEWQAIVEGNNQHPPLALRVNLRELTRDDYLAKLAELNISAQKIPETKQGIVLAEPTDVEQLPGFAEGWVSVQDGAAQLAAELLAPLPGDRVLDACAAPGGKTTHLLEIQPKISELIAIDSDAKRLQIVEENLKRLKLSAICYANDAAAINQWWDGKLFDCILLDAPCSATGVIRRHPDIKLLRKATDVQPLAHEQLRLLKAMWPLLKPDGKLLYATCSVFPEENVEVVAEFLKTTPDAKEVPLNASWGIACKIGRQILPGMHGMDGFFYVSLVKAVI